MSTSPAIRVLVLEDSAADADLMIDALRQAGFHVSWERAQSGQDFSERLKTEPDLILSDYRLPQFNGMEALKIARARGLDTPFILVSGTIGEDLAVEAMRSGADDYLLKDRMARLGEAARHALERRRLRRQQKDALGEARRLAAIVESSNDAIIGRTMDGIVTSWNGGAERTFGYPAAEAVGRHIADLIVPLESRSRVDQNIESVVRGAIVAPYETRRMRKDGALIDVLTSVSPIRNDAGAIVGASVIHRDISERKRAEAHIRRVSRARQMISDCNELMVRETSEQRLLDEVCRIAVEQGGYRMAWVGYREHDAGKSVRPAARAGFGDGYLERAAITWADEPRGAGPSGRAIRSGRTQVMHDITGASDMAPWREDALRLGFRCSVALPLIERSEAFGVLNVYTTEPNVVDADEVALLEEFAGDLAFGISSIRERAARQRAEIALARMNRVLAVLSAINTLIVRVRDRETLFREACRIAAKQGDFGIVWIGTFDARTCEVTPVAIEGLPEDDYLRTARLDVREGAPQGGSVVGIAIRERRPVYNNDITVNAEAGGARRREAIRRGYRSAIALPLVTDGQVVGSFSLYAREFNFFNDDEINLLTELAGNISFALEHMARQEKIDKLSRLRAVSSGINELIVRIHDRDELLREVCRIAVDEGGFGVAWVGVCESAPQRLAPVAWVGTHAERVARITPNTRSDAPYGIGVSGRAIVNKAPVFINDLAAEPDIGSERRRVAIALGFRSNIGLPLIVDGVPAGALTIYAREANFFDDEEVRLLTELAGNVSFALESIARREKIDRLTRIRAVLGQINATIVRVKDKRSLYTEVCRIAVEQGRFGMAWVSEIDPASLDAIPVAWAGEGVTDHVAFKTTARSDTPLGHGVVGQAVRSKKPAVCNDVTAETGVGSPRRQLAISKGFRSLAGLPLTVDGNVVATVTLYAREAHFFDDEEVALLSELAGNISFALENMAKQEKIEKLSRIRAVSREINAAIVRIRDRKDLFQETCRIAAVHGKFAMIWIAEIDVARQTVRPAAWSGFTEEAAHGIAWDSIRAVRGTMLEAVETRKVAVCNRIAENPPPGTLREFALRHGCRSSVTLPLVSDERVVAIISLFAIGENFFDEEELALLEQVAGDLSLALQSLSKQEQLDYLSYYDPLSGLPNRMLFLDRAGQQMRARGGEPRMLAMILLDLERFRYINDTFGHHGGDELLKQVARRLEQAFHGKDYLAHIGNDDFGILIRGVQDAARVAYAIETDLFGCFREPFVLSGRELRVSAKAGVAMHPADGQDAETLFRNAEAAVKRAKASATRFTFYAAEMNAQAAQMLSLETRLRKATEAHQFVLYYQPKIDLASGAICGLEALLRWQDPDTGLVPPGAFIPLLEETGLILDVGRWALARALDDHRAWTALGLTVPRIAVNVSAIQLQQSDFADTVISVVRDHGDTPRALELEVTESLLMKDLQASTDKLSAVRALGISLAMDDFGTGYSSLSYIAGLPIDSVKIDRSFVNGMSVNPQHLAIVTTIIALAHSLNLRVVAEGVETKEQLRKLEELRCDEVQGFLFSKPVPAAEIVTLLRARVAAGESAGAARDGQDHAAASPASAAPRPRPGGRAGLKTPASETP